jgi:hypothetical protein
MLHRSLSVFDSEMHSMSISFLYIGIRQFDLSGTDTYCEDTKHKGAVNDTKSVLTEKQ